jgi:hypothetical protein
LQGVIEASPTPEHCLPFTFTAAGFANWFPNRCLAAAPLQLTAHGWHKVVATRAVGKGAALDPLGEDLLRTVGVGVQQPQA